MKLFPQAIICSLLAWALVIPPATAQDAQSALTVHFLASGRGIPLSRLIGAPVSGADAMPLGIINDIVIDQGAHVAFAIVALEGGRGLGDKDIAVPYAALSIRGPEEDAKGRVGPNMRAQPNTLSATIAMNQQQLADAPSFMPERRSGSGGTPESTKKEPKSSTESGGPG